MKDTIKENGFAIHSWGELYSLIMVILVILAGLAWGLKIEFNQSAEREAREAQYATIDKRLRAMEDEIAVGELPVAKQHFETVERRIDELENRLDHGQERR